jgi:hypothetical protein
MIKTAKRLALLAVTTATLVTLTFPQSKTQINKDRTNKGGVITGRITVEGRSASGLKVFLVPADYSPTSLPRHLDVSSLTDDDGKFRITGVPAGAYTLTVAAPVYVPTEAGKSMPPGRKLIIRESEELHDVNLNLIRGGVITGKVTGVNGQPAVGVHVSVIAQDENGRTSHLVLPNPSGETDDLGVYRLYGIPPGSYLVSVRPRVSLNKETRGYAPLTYYPGVAEEFEATALEVEGGGEVENIDITFGRPKDTFNVTGRVIDAATGSPLSNTRCGYADVTKRLRATLDGGCRTDANGEFRIEHVLPGKYSAFVSVDADSDAYSEPAPFDVTSSDVQGLTVKVSRGSSIIGFAVVEGVDGSSVLPQLSQVTVQAVQPDASGGVYAAKATIAPDGRFHLRGVRPGNVSLLITSRAGQDFSLLRVEHNGLMHVGPIDVPEGRPLDGVKLVLTYGKGNILGQVKIQNGALSADSIVRIGLALAGAPERIIRATKTDPQGRFIMTDIPAGMYELTAYLAPEPGSGAGARRPPVKQAVTVRNGINTEVTLLFGLAIRQ